MNKVILIGNLGSDPEVRNTANGTAVASLSVATTERRKNGDGQWESTVEWHRVTVWGHTADACGRYLSKGSKVGVDGRLQTRKWTDKNGETRYTTEIVADNVEFLGAGGGGGGQQSRAPEQHPGGDEQIPF